ncbi:MAG: sodium/proton-translocating pyrophosphatase, partial [Deltaproteobacteria bacterium]|nr:sodium/proton-translocating pyrophosphatase [Deltaproteobacteria bacterium]
MTIYAFLQNTITAGAVYTAPMVGLGGVFLAMRVLADLRRRDPGSAEMQEIAEEIRRGASVFLRTEYRVLSFFVAAVALLFFFAPGYGATSALTFVLGAVSSAVAGFVGMNAATLANVRTAQAAKEGGESAALSVAFGGGAVMGLVVAGVGLLGCGVLFWFLGDSAKIAQLAPFAMGASSIALFARVGGGIFTKAADVGSDWVGKVEAGIPEDDPRNPGVIADNVGDNVGDVAGMGADLFESYVGAVIAASILAATLSEADVSRLTSFVGEPLTFERYRWALMGLPLVLSALGLFASLLGINLVQHGANGEPRRALRRGTVFSVGVFLFLTLSFFVLSNIRLVLFGAVIAGALGGVLIGAATEFFTSRRPVMRIVTASRTGPATNVIEGIAGGLESTLIPLIGIAIAIVIANWSGGLFGVGIAAVSMLATVG